MELEIKIIIDCDENFQIRLFENQNELIGTDFSMSVLGYMGNLWKVAPSENLRVDSFDISYKDEEDVSKKIGGIFNKEEEVEDVEKNKDAVSENSGDK